MGLLEIRTMMQTQLLVGCYQGAAWGRTSTHPWLSKRAPKPNGADTTTLPLQIRLF